MTAKKFANISFGLALLILTSHCCAKNINMYDQPAANAKLVGSLDDQQGIMTIYTPKGGEWVKVADPRNGNVGWIKRSELGNSSFSFNVMTRDGSDGKYQIVQYGNMPTPTPAQIENELKAMQLHHQVMQRDMQRMMNDMFSMFYYPAPVFVPVIIMEDKHGGKSAATTAKTSAEPKPKTVIDNKNNVKRE